MKRLALAAGLALLVTVSSANGATPLWTATGKVTKLSTSAITVDGKRCKIPASMRATLKPYSVGSGARINCVDGTLRKIVAQKLVPSINQPTQTGTSSSANSPSGSLPSINPSPN